MNLLERTVAEGVIASERLKVRNGIREVPFYAVAEGVIASERGATNSCVEVLY